MGKDDLEKRAGEILEALLEVESPTGKEGGLLQVLQRELPKRGFSLRLQPVPEAPGNLIAQRGKGRILLATHLDTVPAWGHPHAHLPQRIGGEMWGRGAIDAKGQIAALILASELSQAPVSVALFCDEEGEGKGSKAFIPPEGIEEAVVLEPTGMRIGVAQAGSVEVSIRIRGVSAHGAMASSGRNAIEVFFRAWEEASRLPFLIREHPLFPPLRPNLGKITGGIDPQVVPEECEALADFPVPPGWNPRKVLDTLKEVFEGYGGSVTLRDLEPPWEMDQRDRGLLLKLQEAFRRVMGQEAKTWGMPAWTDAASLRQKGIPTLVFGLGDLTLAHTPRERVRLAEVVQLALVLAELMEMEAD